MTGIGPFSGTSQTGGGTISPFSSGTRTDAGQDFTVNVNALFLLHDMNESYLAGRGVRNAEGNLFVATRDVPAGILLTDLTYWEEIGEVTAAEIAAAVAAYLRDNPITDIGGRAYNSAASYSLGDVVTENDILYISLTNNNMGNAVTDTSNWVEFSASTAADYTIISSVPNIGLSFRGNQEYGFQIINNTDTDSDTLTAADFTIGTEPASSVRIATEGGGAVVVPAGRIETVFVSWSTEAAGRIRGTVITDVGVMIHSTRYRAGIGTTSGELGITDLGIGTPESLTNVVITSSTGTSATIREASGTRAGVVSAPNALKLNTINYRGSWTNSLGTNAQPYLIGDIVFDDTVGEFYQLDADLTIVPTAQQTSRPHLTRHNTEDDTPIWNVVSASRPRTFDLATTYDEGEFVLDQGNLYFKVLDAQAAGSGTQLTDGSAWFVIPGPEQPHPHPENLTISVSPTHVIQNSSDLTATVTFRETGDNWEITSIDTFSASRPGITSGSPVIATGGQSATISVNIPSSVLTTAGTISLSATASGSNSVNGQTYSNIRRSVGITVQAAWFAGVRTSAPTETSQLVSQGVFQIGDSVVVSGIEDGMIYVAVPSAVVDESLRFTTSNPNLFYSLTEETAIGDFRVFNLGTADAGNYTVRIGGI